MKKRAVFLLLILNNLAGSGEYRPLSKEDRREFLRTYSSIAEAYRSKNYGVIKEYGPDLVKKYGSINLDSRCADLRPKLKQMDEIVISSRKITVKDSLYALINEAYKAKKYERCASIYQDFFSFLDSEGSFDSLKQAETPRLYETIKQMYLSDPSYNTFNQIVRFRYSDRNFVENTRSRIETGLEQKLLSLSSQMNIDSLLSFKEKYPGIFSSDLSVLIEKARDKYRLSVLRKISPADVKAFYDKFGGPDEELEKALEKEMYLRFEKERSRNAAADYLSRFPAGKHARAVNEFVARIDQNAAIPYDENEGF